MSKRILPLAATLVALGALPALAQDVQYELVNNSDLTLMEFYSSPVTVPDWGNDILGASVVRPGASGIVLIPDGGSYCQYDLQFVMEDGSVMEGQADICATARFELR